MTTTTTRPIAEIESDLAHAERKVLATAEAHKEAQSERDDLAAELHRGRLAADASLPRATIMRSGKAAQTVAVTRRTATTVFTRIHGGSPGTERAWRESKCIPGQWNEHPRPKSLWRCAETLQLEPQ